MLRVRGNPEQARHGAARTTHGPRSRVWHLDPANDVRNADLPAADRVRAHRRPGRTGARVDGVGPVQRAVVSRRAAGEGDWRAHGARRGHETRRGAGAVTIAAPGWHRPRCRWRAGHGRGDRADDDTRRRGDRRRGRCLRSCGLRRERAGHRHCIAIAVSVPTLRAARIDPIAILRKD